MLQGRKKSMARPGLDPRTSRKPCEHSSQLSYRATQSTWDNFPLLEYIRPRICSEPCRYRRDSPFNCLQPEHGPTLSHQMLQGRKKNMARPGLEPRTSRTPCEHSSQLSYQATWSTWDTNQPLDIGMIY